MSRFLSIPPAAARASLARRRAYPLLADGPALRVVCRLIDSYERVLGFRIDA